MRAYDRNVLDRMPIILNLPPSYEEDEDSILVNGMLGKYKLWVSKADKSLTPCLTGEIGGMPGAWENWVVSWHTKHLGEYDTYIDVGANSGYFAFLAAYAGLDVVACEPNPEYVRLLAKSAETNGYKIGLIETAVSDSVGEVTLTVPTDLHGGASIVFENGSPLTVPATTLDAMLVGSEPGKTLIKIDVEGAEPLVFAGAVETNSLYRPTYIMEYTPRHYDESFFDQLTTYGTVTQVDGLGEESPVDKETANSNDDWITLVVRPR